MQVVDFDVLFARRIGVVQLFVRSCEADYEELEGGGLGGCDGVVYVQTCCLVTDQAYETAYVPLSIMLRSISSFMARRSLSRSHNTSCLLNTEVPPN